MSPTLQVVMLAPFYPPSFSGAGLQAQRLGDLLHARGVAVTVLTASDTRAVRPQSRWERGLRVVRFPVPSRSRKRGLRLRLLSLGAQAGAWLATHSEWDLLHLHSFSYMAILPSWVAGWRGRPRLVKTTLLGADDLGSRSRGLAGQVLVASYRRCEGVVALSHELADGFRRDSSFRGRIFEIPNGVDTDRFRPASAGERAHLRSRFGLPGDVLVVVSCGMLDPRKGPVGLVNAVERLAPRRVCVALAGPDGEPQHRREVEAALRSLEPPVEGRLLGPLPPDDVPDLLRASDVFALPSLAEGLPNSVLEALACGLPCVATDIPGSRDALAFGGGRLVPVGDTGALACTLSQLADEPETRRRLGDEARRAALEHFALPRIADAYLDVYRELLG
ncbi:MAG: glycosyltransferase family 4 protein [Myxococcota bacterium]